MSGKKNLNPKIIRRLSIVEGQVRGIKKMVESNKYCVDILRQTAAVREALSAIEDLLLEKHFSLHVVEQVKEGKAEGALKEMITVFKLAKKK